MTLVPLCNATYEAVAEYIHGTGDTGCPVCGRDEYAHPAELERDLQKIHEAAARIPPEIDVLAEIARRSRP